MTRRTPILLVLTLAATDAGAAPRADRKVTIPDVSSREKALFEDVRDDRLDAHDAVTAALALSPASEAVRAKAAARWRAFLDELAKEVAAPRTARERAELALARLHGTLLTGSYDFYQNDMAVLLLEGRFNCVTSALAYQAIGAKLGLDVRGVLVPSHVYVRVVADGVSYDVETTSAKGFLLAQDDDAYQKFLAQMQLDTEKKTGRKLTANKEEFSRREIDAIGVLALLCANHGALAIEESKQKEAIGHFARMSLLAAEEKYARDSRDILLAQSAEKAISDGDLDEARRLLKFALSDPGGDPGLRQRLGENVGYTWALEAQRHLDAKRYESAFASLQAAREWTTDPAVPHNMRAVLNVWGLEEIEAKRYEKGADVFYRAMKAFPDDPDFRQNLKVAYFEWTKELLSRNDYAGAMERGRKLMALLPGDGDAGPIFANAASRAAEARANRGDWQGAVALLEEAWAAAPALPELKDEIVVALTNAGVAWVKQGDRARAEAAWRRALEIDPTAQAARSNLDQLSRR